MNKEDIDKLNNIGATIETYFPIVIGKYKEYQFTIDENNVVRLEKIKNDEEIVVTVEKEANLDAGEVYIKIVANLSNGNITLIQALQEDKVFLKNDVSSNEKEFLVQKNGNYYFLIEGNNGRKTIKEVIVDELPDPKLEVVSNGNKVTMNVKNVYNIEEVEKISYYINDELVQTNTRETSYTVDLESGTNRFKVVIDLKDGTQKVTNEVEEKEKEIVYLYQNGNKYNQITGGYTFRKIQTTDVSYTDSNYLYMYAHSKYGVGYGEIELYTNNAINVTEFDTINFDMDYKVVFGQEAWRTHFYYGLQNSKIVDVPGTNSSSGKVIIMDIKGISGSYRPYFRIISCSASSDVWVKIRSIYLVKERQFI